MSIIIWTREFRPGTDQRRACENFHLTTAFDLHKTMVFFQPI